MRAQEIIERKAQGKALTKEEISFMVNGYVKGEVADYQMSSFCMAIRWQGMNKEEINFLTDAMLHSGDVLNLSSIKGIKADKHSTGGVGDKTTLVLAPLVASLGVKIAKMSGRGLGHTGGTLDKLESIPGFNIFLDQKQFIKQINKIGMAVIGQTGNLDPADKKMYALRDVTATVDSVPLISSSIMSKKLASGADTILLDVKIGDGAFMKNVPQGENLARTMINIGKYMGKDVRALLTDMDEPLGLAIGNNLEVKEAIDTLLGKGPKDFEELIINCGAIMLHQAKAVKNLSEGKKKIKEQIANGQGFKKLKEFVKAQGGDVSYIEDPSKFPVCKNVLEVKAKSDCYVSKIFALNLGELSMNLGAGRKTVEDKIDPAAGIILNKKVGDKVKKGETLLTLFSNKEITEEFIDWAFKCFIFSKKPVPKPSVIKEYLS